VSPKTTSAPEPTAIRSPQSDSSERFLRIATVVFAVAVGVHGLDHLRRGVEVITTTVFVAGTIQLGLAVITIVLVFRRHPVAPAAAAVVGFTSAVGFIAAHLLPHWSSFSDAFTGDEVAPKVTAMSWGAALFEIGADLALGLAGVLVLRDTGQRRAADARSAVR
jgi:hypothetical protein